MHWKLGQENYGVILHIRKVSLNAVKRQSIFCTNTYLKSILKKCDSHLQNSHKPNLQLEIRLLNLWDLAKWECKVAKPDCKPLSKRLSV